MFDSLKSKLLNVRGKLSKNIEESIEETSAGSEQIKEIESPAGSIPVAEQQARPSEKPSSKFTSRTQPSFTDKVMTLVKDREVVISEKKIEGTLQDLEIVLLENDVALPAVDAISSRMKEELTGSTKKITQSVDELVIHALKDALLEVLGEGFSLTRYIETHERPVKILFTGVNGAGKTTTVAKVAHYLKKNGYSVVIGSGDTFRAGANEQMQTHADRIGIKVIRHQEGADPSAVLFDTVEYARAHAIDVVLADTAGRFHNRANLMKQLEKIRRVMKPDIVTYVDEAVAGNDAVIRAEEFNNTVGTDTVILTKADMDTRGGAAISITHTIGKPIMFLGVGQGYDDIIPFEPVAIVEEILGGEDTC